MIGRAQVRREESLAAWDLPVRAARYVEASREEALAKLGIQTLRDLIAHFPFRYVDLTHIVPLAQLHAGQEATVVGRVHDIKLKKPRPRLSVVEVALVDGTGALIGTWFNQPFQANKFVLDERVAFAGTVTLDYGLKQMRNPFVEKLGPDDEVAGAARVIPVHRTTEGLSTNWMRRLIASALEDVGDVPDFLPAGLRTSRSLVNLSSALRDIHFPRSMTEANAARRRFAYEELLCLQLGMAMRRHHLTRELPGIRHRIDGPALSALTAAMGVVLTGDQQRAVTEILEDMAGEHPGNRLLLG
ncbi:ATP-dependent DNA helicase RecG, partial [bacterium]|nr:ATP-dependent DNA helicase RecG [bacterium]